MIHSEDGATPLLSRAQRYLPFRPTPAPIERYLVSRYHRVVAAAPTQWKESLSISFGNGRTW